MSDLLAQFRAQEAAGLAQAVQFHRWSLILIERLIREQERVMLASDQPVEGGAADLTGPAFPA